MVSKAFTLAGLAAVANAHMLMTNPVPYGQSSLTNAPLAPDGSDFPCKKRSGDYALEGASNVYAQGSKQTLKFKGTAVHGGGSCQLSVTTDAEPTKDSVWKVIKSIEGGCPAKNTPGNLDGNSAELPDPFTYDFTVPDELASGNYTLAWTWFNKVGNREMYMNCAPMTVTGSGGSEDFLSGLPNMFTANIGGCQTKEGIDVQFPDAGKDVDRFGSPADLKLPDGCGSSPGGSSTGGSPSSSAAAATSAPAAANSEPATPSGGVFVPLSESRSGPSPPAATSTPSGDSSAPAPPSSGSAGGNAPNTACTSDGQWNCIDGKTFQRCASGLWTPVQPVAAGTACTPGLSTDFKVTATSEKRNLRRGLRFS